MDPILLRHANARLNQQQSAAAAQKKRLQGEEARYTMIFHHARKQLAISIHEYCLSDTVNKLSGNRSHVPGWCYASKEHLGSVLGVSRRSIHNMITSLKKRNILEVQDGTGYLRTTDLWRETVEVLRDKIFN
jgi:hypothetical protein